jgi:PAS domain S-box-containing protein
LYEKATAFARILKERIRSPVVNDKIKVKTLINYLTIAFFLILSLTIIAGGIFYYRLEKDQTLYGLQAIARNKSGEISTWREARLNDLRAISAEPYFLKGFEEWAKTGKKKGPIKEILNNHLNIAKTNYHFMDLIVLDKNCTIDLSTDRDMFAAGDHMLQLFNKTLKTKKADFGDFYRYPHSNKIIIDLMAPLINRKGEMMGVLVLRIDPDKFLYPMIQSWPVMSRTSETILAQREGNEVVYLNELRHRRNTALALRFQNSDKLVPAEGAVRGRKGILEGFDYRGVYVLAAAHDIPDSPWYIIAKTDLKEVFIPARKQSFVMIFLVGALIILSGVGISFFWRLRQADFSRKLYEAGTEREALTQHYAYLTKYANDIIIMTDDNLNIIEVNDSAVQAHGYALDELLKMNIRDLLLPDYRTSYDLLILQLDEDHGNVFEVIHQRKDGTTFHVEVSARVIAVEGKKFYQGIIRDITERKQAEKALKESEQKYRSIFENAVEGIFQTTIKGHFININPATAHMHGYDSPEDMINAVSDIEAQLYVDHERRKEYVRLLKDKGRIDNFEAEMYRKDASKIWTSINVRSVRDEAGNILYFEGAIEDITERKLAEEKLHILLGEIEDKNRELKEAYAELKASEASLVQSEKMSSLGLLSAGIAHELKNPLGIILQGIAYVQLSVEDETVKEVCERTKKSAIRADKIIQNLLNFARQTPPSLSETDIRALIEDVLVMVEHQMSLRNIKVIRDFPFDIPTIMVDSNQMKQVFINIFINATDAMKDGGMITITIAQVLDKEGQPYLAIKITDTGKGIPEDVINKVFDPFYTTKRDSGGTGLGLSVTKGIIDHHKGIIDIESKIGEGTTIIIMFPCDLLKKEAAVNE